MMWQWLEGYHKEEKGGMTAVTYQKLVNLKAHNCYENLDILWKTSIMFGSPRPAWSGMMQFRTFVQPDPLQLPHAGVHSMLFLLHVHLQSAWQLHLMTFSRCSGVLAIPSLSDEACVYTCKSRDGKDLQMNFIRQTGDGKSVMRGLCQFRHHYLLLLNIC